MKKNKNITIFNGNIQAVIFLGDLVLRELHDTSLCCATCMERDVRIGEITEKSGCDAARAPMVAILRRMASCSELE